MNDSLISLLTALGDDELIIGHRHSEWTGHAPHIEEDVAFSSIAQDEIGHATAFYELLSQITGDNPDRLALGRSPDEYRHAILCERPNGDWAYTLARHWLYDTADSLRLEALAGTAHKDLAALVVKLQREERYHILHANTWMNRIAHGPVEGRARLIDSITEAFAEALALFEAIELEEEAVKEGWLPVPSDEMRSRFLAHAAAGLDGLGLPAEVVSPSDQSAEFVASSSGDLIEGNGADSDGNELQPSGLGGRRGTRSVDFDALWDEMTVTYRENPGATW
jgi:ring-1,2-phenylacetyl-CoA epoxidase subunit PaaC